MAAGTRDDPLPGWESGYASANGVDLYYRRSGGDGPPAVIAHGVTDDAETRAPLARDLAAGVQVDRAYDVIAYDARGHGRSDAPGEGYGVADRVADLVGLLDAIDVSDPVLLGHSMGGGTVTQTVGTHPDLARAAVLVDPVGLLDTGGRDADAQAAFLAEQRERIEGWHAASAAEIEPEYARRGPELARLLAAARTRVSLDAVEIFRTGFPDPDGAFERANCPVLVLRADVDEETRERDREAVSHLDRGRLVHVEGAGHCVVRDEYLAAVAHLREFLTGVS